MGGQRHTGNLSLAWEVKDLAEVDVQCESRGLAGDV